MAHDREIPCLHYICAGSCCKKRAADHYHYCQRCDQYVPRAKVRLRNRKRDKLTQLKNNEWR